MSLKFITAPATAEEIKTKTIWLNWHEKTHRFKTKFPEIDMD